MARQEVGKVQELLMASSQEQQEATEEGASPENKVQQQTGVGWDSLQWQSAARISEQITNISGCYFCEND